MSMSANRSRLVAITKELSNQWQNTKESWRDAKAAEFEKKYMVELLAAVDSALLVLDQLDKLVSGKDWAIALHQYLGLHLLAAQRRRERNGWLVAG